MISYIEEKYISLVSTKLRNFKQKSQYLFNFSCPICGDSQKNNLKARGYLFKRKDAYGFMCHNCGSAMSLEKFIRFLDYGMYNEYMLEKFQKKEKSEPIDVNQFKTKQVFKEKNSLNKENLISLKDLPSNFYARKYLEDRKIPLDNIYFTSDFAEYVKSQFPNNEKKLYKEPRIVIPFYDREENLLGVQGRSIGSSKIKYITIKSNENVPKIYGWNNIDLSKTIYVVEGPLDSLFLNNCVATMDAQLYNCSSIIGLDRDYVFIYDNEPRNKQIVSNMRKTIDRGFKICIWPSIIEQKDINEIILSGINSSTIQRIIEQNTYEGIMATMKLNQWEKTK